MINKFYNNKIALLLLSLFLSLLLFVYVKAEQYNENPISFFQNVSEATTETIYNVPVYIDGNVDNYYISGLPDSVSVSLSGPKNVIDQTLEANDFKVVTEDLTDLGEGSYYIQLQMENLPESVSYEISPSSVNISIDTVQTTEMPVQVDIANSDAVADGYSITDITTNTSTVTLTGATSDINSVSQVYTSVTIPDNLSEDYTTTATVITENADGDILNINTDPTEVEVTVSVDADAAVVPIELNVTNEQDDYTYKTTILDGPNASLSGDYDVINAVDSVTATVDVANITETTTIDAPIEVPTGVEAVSPTTVRVQVVPTTSTSNSSSATSSSSSASSVSSSSASATSSSAAASSASSASSSVIESSQSSSTSSDATSEASSTSETSVGVDDTENTNFTGIDREVQADEINNDASTDQSDGSSSVNVFNGILAFFASFF